MHQARSATHHVTGHVRQGAGIFVTRETRTTIHLTGSMAVGPRAVACRGARRGVPRGWPLYAVSLTMAIVPWFAVGTAMTLPQEKIIE